MMKYRLSTKASGDISPYTPPLVTLQSFSITSTSEYLLVFGPPLRGGPIFSRIACMTSLSRQLQKFTSKYTLFRREYYNS